MAAEKPATKTNTFLIPLLQPRRKQVANAGELTTKNLSSITDSALRSGGKVDVSDKVAGKQITQKAIDVLSGAFKKVGGGYAHSDAQLNAAKRELLRYWGFPEAFVKAHGAALKIDQVKGTDGALDEDGRLTGSIGNTSYEGWINSNDDWRKADVQSIVWSFEKPKAAKKLSPSPGFFERNDLTTKAQRNQATDRLFNALRQWASIDDREVAWAKCMLTTGYAIDAELSLESFAKGNSAIDEEQSFCGILTEPDGTRSAFVLALDSGILAKAPEGYSLTVES